MANYVHRLKLKNNISTEDILPVRFSENEHDPEALVKHLFEDMEEGFSRKVKPGDFLVAGQNFGCGPSRESAPIALKSSGLRAVIGQSFSRIFYRNSFNAGLCLVECETNYIDDMD
ncbi:MAG: 3-isopropylmalate dehydratase, partial [Candidatus Omnitrophota bacterium]